MSVGLRQYCVTEPRSPIPRKILFPAVLREDTLSGNPPFKAAFVGAPPQWGFARHGRGLRRVRGGSCAPNAMPPFAPPCGHFASLVRSIAPQSARVPSETLARFSGAFGVPQKRIPPSARRFNPSVAGNAEPGAEAACLFLGTPGMSHAKRYADRGVAIEGWDPKTGNRAATGSAPAVQ